MEMHDAFLDLISDDEEAEHELVDCRSGDVGVRAGELADAMLARAGRR